MDDIRGSPFTAPLEAKRRLIAIRAFGSGLAQGKDRVGVIRLLGFDQYSIQYPVLLGSNCKVMVVYNGSALSTTVSETSTASVSYQMPDSDTGSVLVLIQPIEEVSRFDDQFFLVPCGATTSSDPSRSFMVWDNIVQNETSTATLIVADANGHRTYQGGDFVQVFSEPSGPTIVVLGIRDNLDGSYTLSLSMPTSAFVQQTPAPGLQVYLNNQSVKGSPFTFPMSPSPMVSYRVWGLESPIIGEEAKVTIACQDASGHLTVGGYQDMAVYLVQIGPDTPAYITCDIGVVNAPGLVTVSYIVPQRMGKGNYNCHIIANGTPITTSPVNVSADELIPEPPEEATKVMHYVLGRGFELWEMNDLYWWSFTTNTNSAQVVALLGGTTTAAVIFEVQLLIRLSESYENGLKNGLMFSFDVKIQSEGPIIIRPFTQATNAEVAMTWTPDPSKNASDGAPGSVQWTVDTWTGTVDSKSDENTETIEVPNKGQLSIDNWNPSTIAFLYMTSPDDSNYGLYVFQAGQFITRLQWPKLDGLVSVPTLGFTIQRFAAYDCTVDVSNVMTIPSAFSTKTGLPDSPEEIAFTESWAANYVVNGNENSPGTFDSNGFHVDGTNHDLANSYAVDQAPIPTFGASVSVYFLTALQVYNFDHRDNTGSRGPMIAAVGFGSSYWNPNSGRWVNWTNQPRLEDLGPSNMKVDRGSTNTVFVVTGNGCATVFSNGELAYSITKQFGNPIQGVKPLALFSRWTDITWHAMRAVPGLRPQSGIR